MAEPDTDLRTQFVEQCREAIDEIAATIGRCFGTEWPLSVSDPQEWNAASGEDTVSGPGICLTMIAGDAGYLVLFPEGLPLPEWYKEPGDSEAARIATLPLELGESVLPEEMRGGQSACITVADLPSLIAESNPSDEAFTLTFSGAEGDDTSQIVLIGPVSNPPLEQLKGGESSDSAEEESVANIKSEPVPQQQEAPVQTPPPVAPGNANGAGLVERSRRLMQLEVPVTVRLAEKKIELGQLLKLYPGALITFPKSCDDMLDMYVNNQLFARGEAVKIGEKFGLKINEIGAEEVRDSGVFTV